jgi:hypothetical protein
VPSSPRDKDATWQRTGVFCDERGWSKARLVWELVENKRVLFRTVPPRRESEIDWHDPHVQESLDVDASQVSTFDEERARAESCSGRGIVFVSDGAETFDIEVSLPPLDAALERKPKPKPKPKRKPAPRRPSDAAVEQCLCGIMQEYPDGPRSESWLLTEMKARLGAPPGRERVRNLRREKKYRQWRRPVGHPRNFNSAKNSAT